MSKDDCKLGDRLHIGPSVGNGVHACVRHLPNHEIKQGFVKPIQDGQPLNGASLVSIQYDAQVGDFEVKSVYNPKDDSAPATSTHGPAIVATEEYRSGWDRIFGAKATVGSA